MATPNMNLTEIVPGVTPGPTYATNIVSNFSTIDSHDHTTGKGVRVPSSGLNINADLPFAGNGATGLGKSQFNSLGAALSAAGDYRSVHVVNGELFYLDGSGNSVQLTSSGSVAGSTGNITGLSSPASVTFSTNKYVFRDTATSFAIMESADVRLFEDAAGAITNYIGLRSPSSLAATYNLTYPAALPAATGYLTSDNSGVLTFSTANQIADGRTRSTGTTVSAGGVAKSGRINFGTTSTSAVDVELFSGGTATCTITTTGRPVFIALVGASTGSTSCGLSSVNTGGGNVASWGLAVSIVRDSTTVHSVFPLSSKLSQSGGENQWPSNLVFIDNVSAGTYVYKFTIASNSSNLTAGIAGEIVVFEL